jgi:hypothetical protein
MKKHVRDTHLQLRYICPVCFRADFAARRTLARHAADGGCRAGEGPSVVCAHCGLVWQSQAEMNRHAPFCPRMRELVAMD